MIPFEDMDYHPMTEELVQIIQNKTQITDKTFLRLMVGFYFSMVATQMRCAVKTHDAGDVPVNMFALNLAPSNFGKTMTCNFIENNIINGFRDTFLHDTFPEAVENHITSLALQRANRKGTDPDVELRTLESEYKGTGELLFSFSSGTSAAVRQTRHKLLMANTGSLNLIMDEVGKNIIPNADVFDVFIELYDKGYTKEKVLKNTDTNLRSEEIIGKTPTNLLMFGEPTSLLDGAKSEDELMALLSAGYARRCFFGFGTYSGKRKKYTAEEIYDMRTNVSDEQSIVDLRSRIESLANPVNLNRRLMITKDTSIKLIEYKLICEERADKWPEHRSLYKHEMNGRHTKVLKLAGAYAFMDNSVEVTEEHLHYAIKFAEDCSKPFDMILGRDKPWVKLAKYIADVGEDITQADLAEDLPFYKGSASAKTEMLNYAIAYGYKNNIVIKKSFEDGIEFLRGETLKEIDLDNLIVSYSNEYTENYNNDKAPFDRLHELVTMPNMHWTVHHLRDGYRDDEHTIPGFSVVVLDVDGGTTIEAATALLRDYKYLLHTTKRHTEDAPRFRIILPMNYELKLGRAEYREFMTNLYEWLPFSVDTQVNQPSRKWMTHDGHYEYNEGILLDVLPFIPKTSKNEQRKNLLNTQQSLDNLERWVLNNTGDGNRNNMLLRFGMMLVDAGQSLNDIRERVLTLNSKLPDKLTEAEIMGTIMSTVNKTILAKP